MPDYKIGDRVRITRAWEGVIANHNGIEVKLDGYLYWIPVQVHKGSTVTVEVLEPEYEEGAAYMAADGELYYRQPVPHGIKPWVHVASGALYGHNDPYRPLRKLVPEGE